MYWHQLWRGIQSAVFFYVSCSPWYEYREDRARKKQRVKDKKRHDGLGHDLAEDTYRQPSPRRTNPYWAEEIRLGPGPPIRKATKKQRRDLERLKADGVSRVTTPEQVSRLEIAREYGNVGADGTLIAVSERWKLHQRPDEPLWGTEEHVSSSTHSVRTDGAKSSTTRFPIFQGTNASSSSHFIARNPPINDLSPPAVSNPAQGEKSNMWMLQPPPPAEVMSGHGQANRSRSTTTSSLSSRRTGQASIGRKLSQRMVQEHARRSDMLYPQESRTLHFEPATDESDGTEASFVPTGRSPKRWRNQASEQSTDTVVHLPSNTDDDQGQEHGYGGRPFADAQAPRTFAVSGGSTLQQNFAFPGSDTSRTSKLPRPTLLSVGRLPSAPDRPLTAPRPLQLSAVLGSPDYFDDSPEAPRPDAMASVQSATPIDETRSNFAKPHYWDDLTPDIEAQKYALDSEYWLPRRWSVDF